MKTLIRSIVALTLFTGLVSCEDEQDFKYLQSAGEFQILSPVSGEGVVLSPESPLNPGLSMTWEDMDYGTPTEVTYTIQVDKSGDDFDTPIDLASTTNTYATITSDALNGAAVAAGLTPFVQGGLEVRVRASVGTTGADPKYSGVIVYLVTPYSTSLPTIAVPGNHQGWSPNTAPLLAAGAFGQQNYEGFVWLDGGFKFIAPDSAGNFNWGNTDWGDDGTFTGKLVAEGEVDITAPAGYYFVEANTEMLIYKVTATDWGIVGSATPGGWDNSTPLIYNPDTKKLEADVNLAEGAFKFRANNDWAINLGDDNDGDGYMNYGGPDIMLSEGGNYHVVLDLSNPRAYTWSLTLN
jgi:hypothetical protein